jgi:hypothetical protein
VIRSTIERTSDFINGVYNKIANFYLFETEFINIDDNKILTCLILINVLFFIISMTDFFEEMKYKEGEGFSLSQDVKIPKPEERNRRMTLARAIRKQIILKRTLGINDANIYA